MTSLPFSPVVLDFLPSQRSWHLRADFSLIVSQWLFLGYWSLNLVYLLVSILTLLLCIPALLGMTLNLEEQLAFRVNPARVNSLVFVIPPEIFADIQGKSFGLKSLAANPKVLSISFMSE